MEWLTRTRALEAVLPALAAGVLVGVLLWVVQGTLGASSGNTISVSAQPGDAIYNELDVESIPEVYTGQQVDVDGDGDGDVALFGSSADPIVRNVGPGPNPLLLAGLPAAAIVLAAVLGPAAQAKLSTKDD